MKISFRRLFGATILLASLLTAAASGEDRPPNVVFFLVDDLGWSDLGCYGSSFYETPHIDRFAEEGVRFTQAYAACHVCSPTRASIMTGKYPARLHLTDWLPGRQDFAFQKLRNAPFELDGLECQQGEYLTDRLTDEAEKFIEANQRGPFFLYLSHFAVHDPIQGREDLVAKYQKKRAEHPPSDSAAYILEGNPDEKEYPSRQELHERLEQPAWSGYKVFPDSTVKIKQRQDNVQFAAMVESVDESLGRIVARLKALDLDDNTIVILFSDNGGMSAANFYNPVRRIARDQLDEAFSTSNLPLRGAKGWLYEGGIRVPLIVRWRQTGRRGVECDVPVISNDLYLTILEMAGLPLRPDQHMDGVSLASLVRGDGTVDRDAIYWHFPHYSNHGMQSPGGAVRFGDYKLIEYFENSTVQLFDLWHDIGEQHDLSQVMPGKTAQLRSMLDDWRKGVSAQSMEPNPEYTREIAP